MAAANRPSYLRLLREHRDFRRLWLGEVVSFLGDWFNTVATYTAVQALSGTGQAVAAVMIAKTLPAFLVTPVAGPLIERFDRRRLLIAMDLVRFVGAIGLVASHRLGSLAGLYACTVLMMLCTGIAMPTKNAVLPMILPRERLAAANALAGGTWSIMLALGAALGGGATELLGIDAAFAVDGATFLVSALFFSRLPRLRAPGASAERDETGFVEGLRYLWRTPYVLALVSLKPMLALASGVLVLIPVYGTRVFADTSGPLFVGLLFAARGLGAIVGTLLIRLVFGDAPRTLRRLILAGYALSGIAYVFLAEATELWAAALAFFAAAVGSGMVWVFSGTLLQWESDDRYHGRVFSLELGLTTLFIAAASWFAGAALDRGWSAAEVTLACAACAVLPTLFWGTLLVTVKRRIRRRAEERLRFFYEAAAAEALELARYQELRDGAAGRDGER